MRRQRAVSGLVLAVAAAMALWAAPASAADMTGVRYNDPGFGFIVQHPPSAKTLRHNFDQYLPVTKAPVVGFVLAKRPYQGTNLADAGVYIGASRDLAKLAACLAPSPDNGEQAAGHATIGGADFVVFTSSDAGMGNFYQSRILRGVHDGACYEIAEVTHSLNIGNFTAGTVNEFNATRVSAALDKIAASFAFTR
jgi:hypothetical protein